MENETKQCPECLAEVPKKARKCSHCGSKIKAKTRPVVWILLILVLGSVSAAATSSVNESRTAIDTAEVNACDSMHAYLKARRYVEDVLKSPSTAEFPSRDYGITDLGDNRCLVSSYVDSQNSFGATVRSQWSATVQSDGLGNWTLEEMIFDGEQVYP